MKLKSLTIPNHKGFVNFQTTFDHSSPITTVIGRNGVGKSNLIEIIVSIFRSIDLPSEKIGFDYTLQYECSGKEIKVNVELARKPQYEVYVDGKKRSLTYIRNSGNKCLPNNIFTYYSGTNWRVEQLFIKHQHQFYRKLTEGKDDDLRRFFYCRDVHSFFVLLAFLIDKDPSCIKILQNLGVKELESVLFCLKKPYWYSGKPSAIQLKTGDPRFWYSRGIVKGFLGELWNYSLAPIDNTESKILDFRGRKEDQDRLYMFVPDAISLESFAGQYRDTTEFFKHLESTYIADLIEEVSVSVNLTNGQKLTFSELSEGERQLLTVLGLMKFTRDDESLFLLDEPDTHLNPRWKMDYFDRIESILNVVNPVTGVNGLESSQVLLTTHDPLMLTSLNAKQIRVLIKDDKTGEKRSDLPTIDPKNLGVEAIIQSELYGIRTSLDESIQKLIDERNELLKRFDEEKDPQAKEQLLWSLRKKNIALDELGQSISHPNPYFSNFAKAMSQSGLFKQPHYTQSEYQEVQELALNKLHEILAKEGKN